MTKVQTAVRGLYTQVWHLMPFPQRQRVWGLLALMLMGAVFETFGVGLVIPVLAIMTQPDLLTTHPAIQPAWELLGRPSHIHLVMMGMATLVVAYAIKTTLLAFIAWRQSNFAYGLQAVMSKRLFDGYLGQPYVFHLQHNSAELIRNTVNEVAIFTNMVILPSMILATEGLALCGIAALLLYVEPAGALCVITLLGVAGFAFQYVTRSHLYRWGKDRQFHEGRRIQQLQQAFGGIKEIKLTGREAELSLLYDVNNTASSRVLHRQNVLRQIPRLWFEMLAILGLSILVIVLLLSDRAPVTLLPTLGVFAAAAFRIMVSANRVLTSIQGLRYAGAAVETLSHAFRLFESTERPTVGDELQFNANISLEALSYRFPGSATESLKNICISIPCRKTVGFVGGSGAGKTTLVDLILGLLEPSSGRIVVDNRDIRDNLKAWQRQIGYVPQSIYLADDSLRRNIAYCLPNEEISDESVWQALRAAQLEEFVKRLPQGLDTIVGERGVRLSGGQRQRIGIARALYHDPAVLVLDEATSALDTETEAEVMKSVIALRGEKTVLIIAHRLSTIEHSDWIYRLEGGVIVAQGPARDQLG